MPSIRSSFRVRTRERGYALISAIALAILYFAIMQLVMIDSTRALREAQRFRSKVISSELAENAAELAAAQLTSRSTASIKADDDEGRMTASLQRTGANFEISAEGVSAGAERRTATVRVQGRVDQSTSPAKVIIDYTFHSQ